MTSKTAARSRLAAHRGGARLWPENSLFAFASAIALGCDLLELDVHLAADGALAVIHDPTLDRTTEAQGRVDTLAAADLRRLRLRGPDGAVTGERVPMLEEALALVAGSRAELLLEIKGPLPGAGVAWERRGPAVEAVPGPRYDGLEDRALAALAAAGMLERTTVMAFNPAVIARIRALAPGVRTTLLVAHLHVELARAQPADAVAWAAEAGATDVGLQHTLVDDAVVHAAQAAGLMLGAWTVNEEEPMRRLAALGVDVITTDRPDLGRRVLGAAA